LCLEERYFRLVIYRGSWSEIVNSRDGNASKRLIKTHGALSRDTVYNRHALFITAVETASERFTEYTGADPGEGVIIYIKGMRAEQYE
jgi:hypothetical protein